MYRLVNIAFFFSLVFIFVMEANASQHFRIILACFLALSSSTFAFLMNWLTIDGARSAGVFGVIALGLGGWGAALIVIVYFVSSTLFSQISNSIKGLESNTFRRNGGQVWANGFWFAFWITLFFLFEEKSFLIVAVASIAVATADTWSSEIGEKFAKHTILITSFKKVENGVDGGISFLGTLFGAFGAVFIVLIYAFIFSDQNLFTFIVILSAGIAGCFIDSIMGALFQNKGIKFLDKEESLSPSVKIDNNFVNWASGGITSIITLATTLTFAL